MQFSRAQTNRLPESHPKQRRQQQQLPPRDDSQSKTDAPLPQQAVESKPKILYMVSDSEGCQNVPNTKVPQSSAICDQAFFDEITAKMNANPNMKFAFLGDYFDQGPKVRQSIEGMMKLHKTFNEEGKPERVFIILGNRDVNKLRFMFELNHKLTTLQEGDTGYPGWVMWKDYYNGLAGVQTPEKLGSVEHVTHILPTSMGANKDIGLTSFLPPGMPVDKEQALKYLKASFGIDDKIDGMIDVVAFFRLCKICHYDEESKSFLSHGGGWYRDAFFNKAFVDRLIAGDPETVDENDYLRLMEKYRRALFEGVMNANEKAGTVQESVEAYNDLLTTVLNEVSEKPKRFTSKFVLLQALGLKPTPEEDSKYRSVIQSCSQNGCSGISPDKFKNKDDSGSETDDNNLDDLFDLFENSGVEFVSYGHKPICYYVPLIYQRTSKGRKITFISNDTSNGNRPLDKLGNIVMVTSIEKSGDKLVAKVDMFGNDEAKKAEILRLHPGLLSGAEPLPEYETTLVYNGGPIVNMNKSGYTPLRLSESPRTVTGGRRRRGTKRRRAATRRVRRGNNKRKTNRRVKRSRSRRHSRL